MLQKCLFRSVLFVGMFFAFTGLASAATIYTNSSTGNDTTGDGTSGTPYATFHKAYTEASAGDTIDATGTFDWTDADETGDATTSGYTFAKNLTIQGGGPSTTIFQAASADNTANRRVFTVNSGYTVAINDVTIRYGKTTSSSYGGGGLLIYGTVTIDGSDISYNRTTSDSGGGADVRGKLTIENSAIHHNVAAYMGGGLNRSYYGPSGGTPTSSETLDIINCTIAYNTVTRTYAYYEGGGVYFRRGYGSVTNSTIAYNSVTSGGYTHGIGSGYGANTINLKNNIIASNTFVGSYDGDIGHRSTGSGYGTFVDNGGNIIGRLGYASSGYSPAATSWVDATSYNIAIDGTYVLQDGTGLNSGTLNMDNMLQTNGNTTYGTKTLGITSGSSVAVDKGQTGTNGSISVPSVDQRNVSRVTSTDIGSYEYNNTYATEVPTTQSASIVYSNVQNSRVDLSWTEGDGLYRIAFMKAASTGTASPVNTTTYTASSVFGSGTQISSTGWYAVYSGSAASVTVTGLSSGTNYIVQIFEYNGHASGFEAYLTDTATDNPKTQATYAPVTIYINSSTGNDSTGDGSSGSPYKTFHKAYTESNGGDTINATGTFDWTDSDETGDVSISGYTISHDLIIQGAGATGTIFQAASAENTADRRLFTTDNGTYVQWHDLTIRYGRSTSSSYGGGGLLIYGTSTIDGVDISYNRATADSGGGVDVRGQLTIQNSIVHHNVAHYMGGGLNRSYYSGSGGTPGDSDTLDIINSTIAYNQVTQTVAYLSGGGVYYRRGQGTVTNSTIAYNEVVEGGSTMGIGTGYGAGTIQLKNSIIAKNNLGTYDGDMGHRDSSSGNGTFQDNGGNIIGRTGYYNQNWVAQATTWLDAAYGQAADGTYVLQDGTGTTTGSLYLDTAFQTNGNTANETQSLGITDNSSIAVNNGQAGSNGTISIPSTDQRGVSRVSSTDIGAYETDGTYAVEEYTLAYTAGSGGTISGDTPQTVTLGNDGAAVTAVPNTGYTFTNWSDASTDNPRTDTSVAADVSVTANFTINSYDLTYTAGDNGSITGSTSQSVNYGSNGSEVTAVPDTGYIFSQWSDAVATAARIDTGITEDLSVTATFIDQSALIYVNSSTGDDSTGDGTSGSPYKTFHQGYAAVLADGTLDLTGTFDWTDAVEIGDLIVSGYTIDKNLTIRGQGADVTFIQAASSDNRANRRVFTIASGYTVTIQDLSIRYGKVTGYGNDGGGVRNDGVLTITNCDIYNNRTTGDSGGGIANRHTLTVNGSGIYNNVAYYMGGGIVNSYYVDASGYLTITNSTIAYNHQTIAIAYTEGGGVHFRQGSGTITNSTIAYNTATGVGGVGMDDQDGVLTIKNTIIANNIKRGSSYPVDFGFRQSGYGTVVDNGNNIVGKSQYYTWEGSGDWTDENRDGTFVLYGVETTGLLNLNPSLGVNSSSNKAHSLSLLASSIALDNGGEGSNGDVSVPTTDMRGTARSGDYDIGSFESESFAADNTAPVVSGVAVSSTSTGATITWSTDEASSSRVRYDANSIKSTATPVYNSSSMVTSHSVTLSNLVACSKYYYVVVSRDAAENSGESEGGTFYTSGCAGDTSVSDITEASATPEAGGAVAHTDGNMTIGLTIPTSFSDDPTDFQIKSLDKTTALNSLSVPTARSSVGDKVFDVKALEDPENTLSSFDSDVTVSFAYDDGDISDLDETSLWIYRNDSSIWYALDSCTVDAASNTVTCTTNSFSVFGLFGQSSSSSSSSSGAGVVLRPSGVVKHSESSEEGEVSVPIQITDFVDLNDLTLGDWEYDVAEKMLDLRLIRGEVSDGQTYFNMYDLMDRAEVAVLAARYLGYEEDSEVEESPFEDVPADSWFGPSVAYLKEIGIIEGRSETVFAPSDYVSRSEFFKIMVNVYLYVHETLRPEWEDNMITISDYFVDVPEGHWYVPYMYLAANKSLLSGYLEDGSRYVRPNQQIARIECASIVTNLVYGSD